MFSEREIKALIEKARDQEKKGSNKSINKRFGRIALFLQEKILEMKKWLED